MLNKFLSVLLIALMIGNNIPCFASTITSEEGTSQQVKHVYIDEGVTNVVLLSKKYDFKKEEEQFRDFRIKYAWFWTGIIAGLVYYSYSRVH